MQISHGNSHGNSHGISHGNSHVACHVDHIELNMLVFVRSRHGTKYVHLGENPNQICSPIQINGTCSQGPKLNIYIYIYQHAVESNAGHRSVPATREKGKGEHCAGI